MIVSNATMRNISRLICALLFSTLANASTNANIGAISCSGDQSFSETDTVTISCSGDLSLLGGSISADNTISIIAYGSLFLNDLTLIAPIVELSAFGSLSIGDGVSINTGELNADVGFALPRHITSSPSGRIALIDRGDVSLIDVGVIPLGNITLSPGGQIDLIGRGDATLTQAVPEPGNALMMLAGILLLIVISRVRHGRR